MTITTAECGKKWGGLAYEKKIKLPATAVSSVKNFMDLMKVKFNFHPVEIIGECVCVCVCVDMNESEKRTTLIFNWTSTKYSV